MKFRRLTLGIISSDRIREASNRCTMRRLHRFISVLPTSVMRDISMCELLTKGIRDILCGFRQKGAKNATERGKEWKQVGRSIIIYVTLPA